MNCQNFENCVDDLARNQMMEASTREEALLHSSSCESCAKKLEDQRTLSMQLRTLSTAMRSVEPSSSLEESLKLEVRRRRFAAQVTPRRTWRRSWSYAATAAAVLIVVGAVLAIALLSGEKPSVENPSPVAGVQDGGQNQKPPSLVPSPSPAKEAENTPASRREVQRRPPKLRPASKGVQRPKNLEAVAQAATPTNANRDEIATDFLPIGYAAALNVQEGGQLVRVELPRSAMAKFGLPVNMDRYDERVKADVLVSADGLARAIRFVQDREQ